MSTFFEPSRHYFYEWLDTYYEHPVMTKTESSNETDVYAARIPSLLLNPHERYLVAFVTRDPDVSLGTKKSLIDLPWFHFQSRELTEKRYPLATQHAYTGRMSHDPVLHVSTRSPQYTSYDVVGFSNMLVTMLHTKQEMYEYPNQGTLASALETFQTLLYFKQ
jgi:hypothetical protein